MTTQHSLDDRPWIILTEGESDKRFFDQIVRVRHIPNEFQVRFPDRAGERAGGGRSKFGPWLDVARETEPFIKGTIRGVLIVSDNDDVPQASFEEVQASLRSVERIPIPDAERVVARIEGFPPLVILMLPTGIPGTLETLCLQAAYHKWPIKDHLDKFTEQTNAHGWSVSMQSKMRLQTVIASTCEDRPDAGFSGHWRELEEFHVPLDHETFNELEAFLRGFGALIDGA